MRAAADVADHRVAVLEGAGRLPVPAPPGADVRRPGHRPLGQAGRRGRLRQHRMRRRHSRRAGRHVHRPRGAGRAVLRRRPGRCTPPPTTPSGWPASSRSRRPAGSRSPQPERDQHVFDVPNPDHEGWAGYNKYNWLHGDFPAFRRFFFEQMCSEPHSDKLIEDFLGWSADTDPAVLVDATAGRMGLDGALCPSGGGRRPAGPVPGHRHPRHRGPDPADRHRRAARRTHRRVVHRGRGRRARPARRGSRC